MASGFCIIMSNHPNLSDTLHSYDFQVQLNYVYGAKTSFSVEPCLFSGNSKEQNDYVYLWQQPAKYCGWHRCSQPVVEVCPVHIVKSDWHNCIVIGHEQANNTRLISQFL